jgi:hypothetical protein
LKPSVVHRHGDRNTTRLSECGQVDRQSHEMLKVNDIGVKRIENLPLFTVDSRVPVDLRQWTRRSGFTNNEMANSAIVQVPRTRYRTASRGRGEPGGWTNSAPARRYRLLRQPVFSIVDGCKHNKIRMISPFTLMLSMLQSAIRSKHVTRQIGQLPAHKERCCAYNVLRRLSY